MRLTHNIGRVVLALAIVWAAAMSTQAQQTFGYTTLDYDEESNTMIGYSETSADYSVQAAYKVDVELTAVNSNGGFCGWGTSIDQYGWASVMVECAAEGGLTYLADSTHRLNITNYEYVYEYDMHYLDDWYFSSFQSQNVYAPGNYTFQSPGYYQIRTTDPTIRLGQTHDEETVPRPSIDSIGNAFGPVGTSMTVTIAGTGFRAAVGGVAKTSFAASGSGVTFSNVNVENPYLASATVTIAANAANGNRTVSVTVIPPSGPAQTSSGTGNKTFKVQIPTSVVEESRSAIVVNDPVAANIIDGFGQTYPGGVRCGAYRNFSYSLKDQDGETITQSLPVTEILTNFTITPAIADPPSAETTSTVNGVFWDLVSYATSGTCPGPSAFTSTVDQGFKVQLDSQNVYTLTTTYRISGSKDSSGQYSITK